MGGGCWSYREKAWTGLRMATECSEEQDPLGLITITDLVALAFILVLSQEMLPSPEEGIVVCPIIKGTSLISHAYMAARLENHQGW